MIRLLQRGDVHELRALGVPGRGDYTYTVTGYFDDPSLLMREAQRLSDLGARAVYYTPNPCLPELLARSANRTCRAQKGLTTSDIDISHRLWLLVDLDPVRPSGISSTDVEHQAALDLAWHIRDTLLARGWTCPVVADSGNGGHLLWRIDAPNTPESTALIRRSLVALDTEFSTATVKVDLTVYNAARVWKVPGTMTRKGSDTPDRPHRASALLDVPVDMQPLPLAMLEALAPLPEPTALVHVSQSSSGFNIDAFVSRHWPSAEPEHYQGGRKWVLDVCPFNPAHTNGSAAIIERAGGMLGFTCLHNGCSGKDWRALRALHDEPPAPVTIDVEAWIANEKPKVVLMRGSSKKEGVPGPALPIVANAMSIIRYDEDWAGVLAFDELAQCTVLAKRPPWTGPEVCPWAPGQRWTEHDDVRLVAWISRKYNLHFSLRLGPIVEAQAKLNSFHPIRDYLDSLKWDGQQRVESWLVRYLGAEDVPYVRLVGTLWLISAVARAYQPGCKADYVLMLEGEQGAGKSTALSLLGRKWFLDTSIDLQSKDAFMSLRGQWIIELSELDSLNRSEAARAKAFFSSRCDSYRPPYAARNVDQPRQCVFAGTTNESSYLKDSTGNRRFWPVLCGDIDLEALAADVDQIWAEVAVLYRAGHRWHPRGDEVRICAEQQEERYSVDAWELQIAEWMEGATSAPTLLDVCMSLGFRAESDVTPMVSARVSKILAHLGYITIRPRGGSRRRVYVWGGEGERPTLSIPVFM
jgi:hypothetical protein